MKKKYHSLLFWTIMFRPQRKKEPLPPTPQQPNYLCFEAAEENAQVGFIVFNEFESQENPLTINLEYSLDNGITWLPYEVVHTDNSFNAQLIELPKINDKVLFKGNNETLSQENAFDDQGAYLKVVTYGAFNCRGDVTSLLNGIGGDISLQGKRMISLFEDNEDLLTAPNLPSTTLGNQCYEGMFQRCTSLISAPTINAKNLSEDCFSRMFFNCANVLAFNFATINDSNIIFSGCTSAQNLTILATIPPTINSNTLNGLANDCEIKVPAQSVNAYKAAPYWSARADYIVAQD